MASSPVARVGAELLSALLDELKGVAGDITPAQKELAGKVAASAALVLVAHMSGKDTKQAVLYLKAAVASITWIAEARVKAAFARAARKVLGSIGEGLLTLALA